MDPLAQHSLVTGHGDAAAVYGSFLKCIESHLKVCKKEAAKVERENPDLLQPGVSGGATSSDKSGADSKGDIDVFGGRQEDMAGATPGMDVGALSADAEQLELDKSMQENAGSSPRKRPGSCSDKEEADAASQKKRRLEGHTSNESMVPTELAEEPPSAESLSAAPVAPLAQAGTISI